MLCNICDIFKLTSNSLTPMKSQVGVKTSNYDRAPTCPIIIRYQLVGKTKVLIKFK